MGNSVNWWEWLIPFWAQSGALIKTIGDVGTNTYGAVKDELTPHYGDQPTYVKGPLMGSNINSSQLGAWFKQYAARKGVNDHMLSYLNSLSDSALGGILDEYWNKENVAGSLTGKRYTFDSNSALQDFLALSSLDIPAARSYEEVWNEAQAKIDAENEAAGKLYDQALDYQKDLYNKQMGMLDKGYNNLAKQTLAMDYQKNNQLLGSLGNNMNKARQNALEAGASAGVRLANNVNTLLSTQNAQAQQSLATSNNLAQMLMNQRNAAMGLGSNLANAYSTNANQRAGLIQGNFERKQAAADSAWNTEQNIYNDKVNAATSALQGNAFVDSYKGYGQTQNYNKKQTSGSNAYA